MNSSRLTMVEFNLTLPPKQNVVWIPKILVECLGREIKVTPNSIAAVMYPADADLDDVLASLKIIAQVLQAKKDRRHVK